MTENQEDILLAQQFETIFTKYLGLPTIELKALFPVICHPFPHNSFIINETTDDSKDDSRVTAS